MSPLERRCRRVVRLLPRAERDARGDEITDVLLDLSTGRTRPPPAEVAAVAGLSLRLRLAARADRLTAAAPALVATLPIVVAPWPIGSVVRVVPHASGPTAGHVAIILGLWLAAGGVWLLGLRRLAVVLWLALAGATLIETARTGYPEATWYLTTVTLPVVVTVAALVVAVRRGVPAPEPRWAWLLLMPATAAGWAAALLLPPSSLVSPVTTVAATTGAVLAGVLAVTARTTAAGLAPAAVVAVLTLAGWAPPWVGVVVLTAVAGTLISRRRAGRPAPATTGPPTGLTA